MPVPFDGTDGGDGAEVSTAAGSRTAVLYVGAAGLWPVHPYIPAINTMINAVVNLLKTCTPAPIRLHKGKSLDYFFKSL